MGIDWQLLWDMGGHGPYVWASYGIAVLLIAAEAAMLCAASRDKDRDRGMATCMTDVEKEQA